MDFYYQIGDEIQLVTIESQANGYRVIINDKSYDIAGVKLRQSGLTFQVESHFLRANIAHEGSVRYVAIAGETWQLERLAKPQPQHTDAKVGSGAGSDALEASMPGQVVALYVTEGNEVERGQTLILLEAMKMELRISAPHAGIIRQINCEVGQIVKRGQRLIEVESAKHQ